MDNHELLVLCCIFILGLGSGAVYFLGIWKSIQSYQKNRNTTVFVLGVLLRLVLLLFFLWFVARGDMTKYFVFFAGFIIAKFIALKISNQEKKSEKSTEKTIR